MVEFSSDDKKNLRRVELLKLSIEKSTVLATARLSSLVVDSSLPLCPSCMNPSGVYSVEKSVPGFFGKYEYVKHCCALCRHEWHDGLRLLDKSKDKVKDKSLFLFSNRSGHSMRSAW